VSKIKPTSKGRTLYRLKCALAEWRKNNKTEWVSSKLIWEELNTGFITPESPFTKLPNLRYWLNQLVQTSPKFVQSKGGGTGRATLFRVRIPGGKYEQPAAPTIQEQVEDQQESFLWKKKYQETKKLLDHSHKANILEKLIIEQVHRDIVALPPASFMPPKAPKTTYRQDRSPEEAMLVISDAHIGEFVSKDETDGLCEYSFEIFVRRLQHIVDTIRKLNKHKINVGLTKLTVAVLGDMCAGNIHEELEITNEAHIVTQACMGGYVFSQFIREISTLFPEVEVICLGGNHGRIQKQKRFKQKNLDWDRVLYEIAAAYSQQYKNVTFTMPRSTYWVGDINGHTFLLFHGDHIRSWGGIPFYGVLRTVTNLKTQYAPTGRIIKYSVLGHFHTMGELADVHGDTILNGAFMGGNDFSIGAMAKVTYPGQHYFGVHPRIGRSWRYPLRLDTAPKDSLIRYKYDLDKSVADVVQQ